MQQPELLVSGPDSASAVILLGHGAGAPMDSPFMATIAELLAARGLLCLRFEFAYMAARRRGGKQRPPPKAEALCDEYRAAIGAARARMAARSRLLIGGKSMGGRIASLVADPARDEHHIVGLVCLGYPFHPTSKPDQLRTAHLEVMRTPTLIVQGERDPFGNRAEMEAIALSAAIAVTWMPDGDHDFGPRGASGFSRKANLAAAADATAAFAHGLVA